MAGTEDRKAEDKVRRNASDKPSWVKGSVHITVRVGIGNTARDFHIHEHLLRAHSDLFEATLRELRKQKPTERLIVLPNGLVADLDLFAIFVYTGKVFIIEPADPNTTQENRDKGDVWSSSASQTSGTWPTACTP